MLMTQDTLATNETTINKNVLDKLKYDIINDLDRCNKNNFKYDCEVMIERHIDKLIKKLNL